MRATRLHADLKELDRTVSDLTFFLGEEFVENYSEKERALLKRLMDHGAEASRHLAIMRLSLERYMSDGAM